MSKRILAVGRVVRGGEVQWDVAPLVEVVTNEDLEAAARFGFDDSAPSLGILFTPTEGEDWLENDNEFNRWGGA